MDENNMLNDPNDEQIMGTEANQIMVIFLCFENERLNLPMLINGIYEIIERLISPKISVFLVIIFEKHSVVIYIVVHIESFDL